MSRRFDLIRSSEARWSSHAHRCAPHCPIHAGTDRRCQSAAAPVLGVPSVVLAGGAVGGRDGAAPARRPAVELRQLVRVWHFLVWSVANDLSQTRTCICVAAAASSPSAHTTGADHSHFRARHSASLAPDGLRLIRAGRGGRRIRHGWRREGRVCWRLWAWAAALRRCCWCLQHYFPGDSI